MSVLVRSSYITTYCVIGIKYMCSMSIYWQKEGSKERREKERRLEENWRKKALKM